MGGGGDDISEPGKIVNCVPTHRYTSIQISQRLIAFKRRTIDMGTVFG